MRKKISKMILVLERIPSQLALLTKKYLSPAVNVLTNSPRNVFECN